MAKELKVYGLLLDENNRYHFYADADLDLNSAKVYYVLPELMGEDVNLYDQKLKERFGSVPDHHFVVKSEALVKLVEQFGGITVNGEKVNGEKALQLVREGEIDAVVDGLKECLKNMKNLMFALPNLMNSLKDTYQTDFPVMDLVKIALSEVGDLKEWTAELETVRK